MNLATIGEKLKKNWLTIIFYAIILTLVFSTNAKSWLLQQMVSVGFFKAKIENTDTNNNYSKASFFSYSDIKGNFFSTSDLKGKVIFINVWASWCPPCRAEMPDLNKLYNKYKNDDRIVFIFLNEDNEPQKGINYLNKSGFNIPFYKSNGVIPEEIFKSSLPTTVVINKAGEIVMKHHGVAGYNNSRFTSRMESLF